MNQRTDVRRLTDHLVPGCASGEDLHIKVLDQPGAGGAHHLYKVSGFNTQKNASAKDGLALSRLLLFFQNGTITEKGVNGITNEVLIAIVIDRLRSFQAGPFPCEENAAALLHLEQGMEALHIRTLNRKKQGVEGKLEEHTSGSGSPGPGDAGNGGDTPPLQPEAKGPGTPVGESDPKPVQEGQA